MAQWVGETHPNSLFLGTPGARDGLLIRGSGSWVGLQDGSGRAECCSAFPWLAQASSPLALSGAVPRRNSWGAGAGLPAGPQRRMWAWCDHLWRGAIGGIYAFLISQVPCVGEYRDWTQDLLSYACNLFCFEIDRLWACGERKRKREERKGVGRETEELNHYVNAGWVWNYNPPAPASQCAGITVNTHHAWLRFL